MNILSQEVYNSAAFWGLKLRPKRGVPTANTEFLGSIGVSGGVARRTLSDQITAVDPTQDETRAREWKDLRYIARLVRLRLKIPRLPEAFLGLK